MAEFIFSGLDPDLKVAFQTWLKMRKSCLCLLALLHCWVKSGLLLKLFSLYDQSGKWPPQTSSDGLRRIQIRASLSAFQKPNIGLMQAGLFRQSRPAKSSGFAIFLHHRGETVGQFHGNALHHLKMPGIARNKDKTFVLTLSRCELKIEKT